MTTLSPTSVPNQKLFSFARNLLFWLFLFAFSNTTFGQEFKVETKNNLEIGDSTEMQINGFPIDTDITNISAPRFEYFWILGNGNFVSNTRNTFVRELYRNQFSTGTSYGAKVYSTSIYIDRDDEPTKVSGDINSEAQVPASNVERTKAVKSGYLNLQFNHNEIIPEDTTVWVLSVKNVLPAGTINGFSGQVYLFYNSPIKIYEEPLEETDSEIKTKTTGKQTLNEEKDTGGATRFPNFKFNTSYVYGNFRQQSFNIDNGLNTIGEIKEAYQNGLMWHFDFLAGGDEEHLFIEFEDADNIFENDGDAATRIVDFLAVLVADDPDGVVSDSLTIEERQLVTDLKLGTFISDLTGNNDLITPDPDSNDIQALGSRIIDIFTIEAKAKRAHDPNQLRIQACTCPPNAGGAQKLIFIAEFENDGEAATKDVEIAIPLPSQIDASSITGDLLAFHAPGLESSEISHSLSPNNDTVFWKFPGLKLRGTKEVGTGSPLTYGEITFTALTKAGTDLSTLPEMHACITFHDVYGKLTPVCTPSVTPEFLTLDTSTTSGTQDELSCAECVSDGCVLPTWLICLIIAVIIFALWIAFFSKKEEA